MDESISGVSTCEGESPRETTSITATFSRLCADFCNPRPGNVHPKVLFAVDSPLEARDRSAARMALVDRDNPHKEVRFAGDSPLEGAVTSELVSESEIPGGSQK